MTLKELEHQLLALSDNEKVQIVQLLSQPQTSLIQGIEKTPGVCGGSACIVRTRIPVWLLVEALHAGASEAQLLLSYPSLRAEDLTNAWAYYRANKEEIDREILENESIEI